MHASHRAEPLLQDECAWGAPGGRLTIRSGDGAFLAKARAIFGCWPDTVSVRDRSWHVRSVAADDARQNARWEVRASDRAGVVRAGTADQMLAIIEAWAQEAFIDVRAAHGAHDAIPLHGALLTSRMAVVAILGAPMSGKSTLAFALWQQGWRLCADDLLMVDAATARAWPSPRRAHLRGTSEPLFDPERVRRLRGTAAYGHYAGTHFFHPSDVDGQPRPAAAARITALVFLGRTPDRARPAGFARVEPAHALLGILPFSARLSQSGLGTAITRVAPLANAVPAYDLSRDSLDRMTALVSMLAQGTSSP